ncbi:MAG: hypothetical protein J6J87_08540 [Oscillospiraceae bacterium]|nr:hypothetical protein [Oscillospiraceae bacterium]
MITIACHNYDGMESIKVDNIYNDNGKLTKKTRKKDERKRKREGFWGSGRKKYTKIRNPFAFHSLFCYNDTI